MLFTLLRLLGGRLDWGVQMRSFDGKFVPHKHGLPSRAEAQRYLDRYRHPDTAYRIEARVTFQRYFKDDK